MQALMQRVVFVLATVSMLGAAGVGNAADIAPFVGTYEGKANYITNSELKERDLSVSIRKRGAGFTISGVTVIAKPDGKIKRKKYNYRFLPTRRGKITVYYAAARANMFGGTEPYDPMKGDPYMWARISGKTLYVYGVHVTEEGGYEIQTFERTLTKAGMRVKFNRTRDGKQLREIVATLKRVK